MRIVAYLLFFATFFFVGLFWGVFVGHPQRTSRCHTVCKACFVDKLSVVQQQVERKTTAIQMEGLLREFRRQDRRMKRSRHRRYEIACVRAWVTLQIMKQNYCAMAPSEKEAFFNHSQLLPSPVHPIRSTRLLFNRIRRNHVRHDFPFWLRTCFLDSDDMTAFKIYKTGLGLRVEQKQKERLSRKK